MSECTADRKVTLFESSLMTMDKVIQGLFETINHNGEKINFLRNKIAALKEPEPENLSPEGIKVNEREEVLGIYNLGSGLIGALNSRRTELEIIHENLMQQNNTLENLCKQIEDIF